MKYDDASWHSGGNFPADLPASAAATHSGMFVVWAFLSGFGGPIPAANFPDHLQRLQSRSVTPGAFFLEVCSGKLLDEDFSDEGNAFARAYFDFEHGQYLADYDATLGAGLAEIYYVGDTWENFDRLKSILDRRYREWKAKAGTAP
jgi:hypothetical protein